MLTRAEMRDILRAAHQRWNTPEDARRRSVAAVREVLDDQHSAAYMRDTANKTLAAMQSAGWIEAEQPTTA